VRGSRPDWQILCELMAASGYPQSFHHPSEVMDEIARVAPVFGGVSYSRLEGDGLQWPVPDPGHPGTPFLYADGFPRGRARLSRVEHVRSPGLTEGLTLIIGRALEYHNAASMTREGADPLLHPADTLEIHPRDASARGIAGGDPVIVESRHGRARALARITDRVARGVVFLTFHRPETGANEVTGAVHDQITGCPEFKATTVEVSRA
jgi:predicted molibdopterin-dependent oxidoreductase YjgC